MDLEQRLRASLIARKPGAMFTARVLARVARGAVRRRSRFILMGTVLVVGAAAAMLTWRLVDVQRVPVEVAANPVVSGSEPVVEKTGGQAIAEISEPMSAELMAAELKLAPSGHNSSRFSVRVMPLRQEAQNVAARGPVEELHAALLDELRKVPGLALRVPGEAEPGGGGQADYVLTMTNLATTAANSGSVVARSTDGNTTYTAIGDTVINGGGSESPDSALWVEMKVESRQPAASRYTTLLLGAEGTAGQGRCNHIDGGALIQVNRMPAGGSSTPYASGAMSGVVNLALNRQLSGVRLDMDYGINETGRNPAQQGPQPRLSECLTPAQLAAAQVETLRLQVFPPDSAFQQGVVARLGETSRDQAGETKALQVIQVLASDGGSRLDAGTLQAIVRFAAGQSVRMRTSIWGIARWTPISHPALVAPLVESLRHDPDQQVRLAALATLETNFSTNPVVRSALEGIGQADPDVIVRAAVRRSLYGQAQWRDEILATLDDTNLPYEARLAPLLASGSAVQPQQQEQRLAALREQQVLRPLVTLIREHLQDSDHAQLTSDALVLLGKVDDPAVFDLFMQVMRETPTLKREISVRPNGFDMSGPVSSWVLDHRKDPRVLTSLSNLDPQLRTVIEQSTNNVDYPVPAADVGPDLDVIPSNLLQRMREIYEKTAGPAPVAK